MRFLPNLLAVLRLLLIQRLLNNQWKCRYVAELIIGLLQDLALQAVLHPPSGDPPPNLALPPPMFDDNLETNTQCFRGNHLQEHLYATRVSREHQTGQTFVNLNKVDVCLIGQRSAWQPL